MIISQTTDSIPSYTIFEYQADRKAVDYVHFCKSDIFSYLRCWMMMSDDIKYVLPTWWFIRKL